jgi:hypothetical protein
MNRTGKRYWIVPAPASRDVRAAIATTIGKLRRGDVRALAVVLVTPQGMVHTMHAGGRDGHFHHLQSGAKTLADRIARDNE